MIIYKKQMQQCADDLIRAIGALLWAFGGLWLAS